MRADFCEDRPATLCLLYTSTASSRHWKEWRCSFLRKGSLLFCLFGFFSSHSRIFNSYGDVTIAGEGLQILTCARHSWQLSSEGSLACHTYCDTGHPFIMVISEDPWHSHLLPSVWHQAVTTYKKREYNCMALVRISFEIRRNVSHAEREKILFWW